MVTSWKPNRYYIIGDVVEYEGNYYICRQSHTSQCDWAPGIDTLALWLPVSKPPTEIDPPVEPDRPTNPEPPEPTPPEIEPPEPIPPEPVDPEPIPPEPIPPEPVDPEPIPPEPVDPEPVDPEPVDPEPVDPEPVDPEDVAILEWKPNTDYLTGSQVSYKNLYYVAVIAHISQLGFEPSGSTTELWRQMEAPADPNNSPPPEAEEWVVGKQYTVNDRIIYKNKNYVCMADHVSTRSPSPYGSMGVLWSKLQQSNYNVFESSKNYVKNLYNQLIKKLNL